MKYSKEERLDIGKQIYEGEINLAGAAIVYDINIYTARNYLRLYKASITQYNNLSSINKTEDKLKHKYEKMSKEELIDELLRVNKKLNHINVIIDK